MNRLILCVSVAAMAYATSSIDALAGELRLEPSVACGLLADQGLRTRGGYRANGDVYRCRSQRRPLTGGGQPSNTLRFSARGKLDEVRQLMLELQVNSLTNVQRAHRELADHARLLFEQVLNRPLLDEIEAAILSAVRDEWTVGNHEVRLDRITAGVSRYELQLVIE